MFRHLSKITATTFKSLFTHQQYNQNHITPNVVESWLKDMQIGLDALLDDDIMMAEDTFSSSNGPFHAFGYALILYTKAMLAMEKNKIEQAAECLFNVEIMLKRIMNKSTNTLRKKPSTSSMISVDIYVEQQQHASSSSWLELQFELLHANCILMSATLQFLQDDGWIDNLKAAYDLRRAFKIYERLFETMTGVTLKEYETNTSMIYQQQQQQKHSFSCTTTVEHGAYFGIGLFNVIFSLLPTKVGKILNHLGFHSSISTAIFLLLKSYSSHHQTMYSPLSALVLLLFYTNISIYIQPHINQFFHLKDAKSILDAMKLCYPHGQIWCLLQGKFKKLQGELVQGIQLLEKSKHPVIMATTTTTTTTTTTKDALEDHFRIASITELVQFRSFVIYELGWTYIYAGAYFEASESFFCLAGMCNWSRIFYHYLSTCCMMADGLYDKAVLEVRQMTNMLDQKKKLSSNEQYAESRVRYWIETSRRNQTSLKETLQYQIVQPLWELVYMWNGTCYWKHDIVMDIKKQWKENHDEPLLCLFMGVIQRDLEDNIELALECFNLILVEGGWIIPFAMYEIAATQLLLLLRETTTLCHIDEYKLVIFDWIQCIENYYIQNAQDNNEWETRMQIKCQLLVESCNSI